MNNDATTGIHALAAAVDARRDELKKKKHVVANLADVGLEILDIRLHIDSILRDQMGQDKDLMRLLELGKGDTKLHKLAKEFIDNHEERLIALEVQVRSAARLVIFTAGLGIGLTLLVFGAWLLLT